MIETTELSYNRVKLIPMEGSGDPGGLCSTKPYMILEIMGNCFTSRTFIDTTQATPKMLREAADRLQANWDEWDRITSALEASA